MKVLKFGGSSLADATRYMRVLEISTDTHQTEGAAVVLSAPKGVTNALSLLCEQAQSGADYGELFAKLNMTLHAIADVLLTSHLVTLLLKNCRYLSNSLRALRY
jgi:aspartokinase/homoserine dehydrogenase 1